MVDVCLLGCGGMMPLPQRRLSALLYRFDGRMILIDCGEGTQVAVKQAGWGFKTIDAVCFTHYHADHIAGLPGFLLTLGNTGRTDPLALIGPPGLFDVVRGLTVISPSLPYDLNMIELPPSQSAELPIGHVTLGSLPADHAVPCLAYRLDIKRPGLFDAKRARDQDIPLSCWKRLQSGETVDVKGRHFEPEMVLGPPRKGIRVTYCTDTRPVQALAPFCSGSDLLVCEGLYGEDEKLQSAVEKKHMTFSEAAGLAKASESRELWLTHYSPSLKDPDEYIEHVRRTFANAYTGHDLKMKTINYSE